MKKHRLWYVVINGGDGSVSVYWFPSEALARFYYKYDDEIHEERYSDDPVSCLCYKSNTSIEIEFSYTKETLLKQLRQDLKDEIGYQEDTDDESNFDYQPGIDKLKPLIKALEKIKGVV